MMDVSDEIIARMQEAADCGKQIEGLLFHGTCEKIDGPLRPGGDGLLWTSDSPVIAQQYIPASGLEIMCSKPSPYEMESRVQPNKDSVLYRLACKLSGKEIEDIEYDRHGRVSSWRIPDGWPMNRDVIAYLEGELGYEVGKNDCLWLKAVIEDGIERIMPARWTMAGTLYVTLACGLNLKDIRQGTESDLTAYEHNNFAGFAFAADGGYDGVVINDFAQTTNYGNFGHRSYGLNERGAAKVEWIALPATRFELDVIHPFPAFTPDLADWLEGMDARRIPDRAP